MYDPLAAPIETIDPEFPGYREPGGAEPEIQRKHELQMAMHVAQFGPLGQLMSGKLRKRLEAAVKRAEQ